MKIAVVAVFILFLKVFCMTELYCLICIFKNVIIIDLLSEEKSKNITVLYMHVVKTSI